MSFALHRSRMETDETRAAMLLAERALACCRLVLRVHDHGKKNSVFLRRAVYRLAVRLSKDT